MNNDIQTKSGAYTAYLERIDELNTKIIPVRAAYIAEMQNKAKHYEAVTEAGRGALALTSDAAAFVNYKKLAAAGHIKEVEEKVEKPAELVSLETEMIAVFTDYIAFCKNAVAYAQFVEPKSRKSANGEHRVRIPGDKRKATVTSVITSMFPAAEVTFEGEDVRVTLNGKSEVADVYNYAFDNGQIPKKVLTAIQG